MLEIVATVVGFFLIGIAFLDAFETIVLPRRVTRQFRLARIVSLSAWGLWAGLGRRIPATSRETYLSFYGPLSIILLVAIWAAMLILGFGLIGWGLGLAIGPDGKEAGFGESLYLSGSSFFTLGLGDVRPDSTFSRILTVIEAGAGFATLALIITYLPVLYQSFSRREIHVSLLDSRAGSPPTAGEFLRRLSETDNIDDLIVFLQEWERWAAELLETHLSYPVLATYRSQHERQSWLAALTLILDVSAVVIAGGVERAAGTARLTFAMARHTAVDLSQVVGSGPRIGPDRLPEADFETMVAAAGTLLAGVRREELTQLRRSYEPNVAGLSEILLMPLPAWLPAKGVKDDWESTPWS